MVYVTPALPSKASSSGTSIAWLASLPFLLTGDLFSSGLDLSRCGMDTIFTLPAPPGHGLSPAGSGDEGCDRSGPRLDSTPGQTLPVASPGPQKFCNFGLHISCEVLNLQKDPFNNPQPCRIPPSCSSWRPLLNQIILTKGTPSSVKDILVTNSISDSHPFMSHLLQPKTVRSWTGSDLAFHIEPGVHDLPKMSQFSRRGWHGPCSETLMAPGVITLLAPSTGSQERCLWTHCCGNCLGKRKLTDESFSTHSCNSTSVTRAIGNQPAVCGAMIENGMKLRPEHRCVQSELGCARRHLVIEAYCAAYCLGERNLCRATNQWPEVPEPCFRGFERNRCPWDGDAESKRIEFQ
ncbi:hypothetical protein MJG53_018479 [Ovis ammon polii x Ovis aries]|uniref:Uncharacterized protein n=1 Tax=Ovis ammon polii x Ovis aries TaxID=2918886 RepID=A0ACB9U467_9CETA|nr:hypothetical protein MJG53_018479 [Ovis ammon polii x Ovis aries]